MERKKQEKLERKAEKKKARSEEIRQLVEIKDFFDLVAPSAIKFNVDHYICGNSYRSVWAIRDYPRRTQKQALLARLSEMDGVTLHLHSRTADPSEMRKILQNANRVSSMNLESTDTEENVTAHGNLSDIVQMEVDRRISRDPFIHLTVLLEMSAPSLVKLRELEEDVRIELGREIIVDRLPLRQQEGFLSVMIGGKNMLGEQFERILPSNSVGNLFPFSYSGKTDPTGMYYGKDKFGSNIVVDFDLRAEDKTNANIIILGNSGQGKSYLMKAILTNLRMSGKSVICIDPEAEYEELTENLGGTYLDLTSGDYLINPLEPRSWADEDDTDDEDALEAFRKGSRLSQHISFLKDFFRSYKDFTEQQIEAIEIMLEQLYRSHEISDNTDFARLKPTDYPTMGELYALAESEYQSFTADSTQGKKSVFTEELLREICLVLRSMCIGAESRYFNGHTNIKGDRFVCFGVKGLMDTSKQLRNAMLFNILSYMNHRLLTDGNTVGAIDELYLFLDNLTSIEYIRNAAKRVRKKDSALVLSSQNIEDFLIEGVREYTKPLFSIPTHQFLFYPGNIDPLAFRTMLQLEESEFALIRSPERGSCLFRCGGERYLLQVKVPEYKAELFGKAGGR